MPGFLPSEVKTYQYAANIVHDELIDKFGIGKIKNLNINKIKQAIEIAKSKGLTPHQAAETVYNSAERHVQGVKNTLKQPSKEALGKVASKAEEKVVSTTSVKTTEKGAVKAISKLGKYGKITGGLALATALIYGSYEVYKRYLSAAAKACANKSGKDKKDCIDRYRSNARREQIKKLHNHLQDCQKSKDPISCKKTILIKIQKISKRVK